MIHQKYYNQQSLEVTNYLLPVKLIHPSHAMPLIDKYCCILPYSSITGNTREKEKHSSRKANISFYHIE